MKFIPAGIALYIAAATAFSPSTSSVRDSYDLLSIVRQWNTNLDGHALSGNNPSTRSAIASDGSSGIPGFSGFDHALARSEDATAPTVTHETSDVESFSGFGHATTQIGRCSASPIGQNFVSPTSDAPSPASPAPTLVFSSFVGMVIPARTPPAAPVSSGIGHSTGKMGGYPPLVGRSSAAPSPSVALAKPSTAPHFSGFGHSKGQMGGNPPLVGRSNAAPSPSAAMTKPPAAPHFSGFGHSTGQMGGNPSFVTKR